MAWHLSFCGWNLLSKEPSLVWVRSRQRKDLNGEIVPHYVVPPPMTQSPKKTGTISIWRILHYFALHQVPDCKLLRRGRVGWLYCYVYSPRNDSPVESYSFHPPHLALLDGLWSQSFSWVLLCNFFFPWLWALPCVFYT